MKILCILHSDFETPGVIEDWAVASNHSFLICKPYQGESCLQQEEFDLLIIMGGPQSPLEIDKAPYLKDEIALIQRSISQDKVIIGFCLGAQLIGEALGAKTENSPYKEVGVFPITLTDEGLIDPLLQGFPKEFLVIHWHNDMPGLTPTSEILAHSKGCPRQIIRYAPKIVGFQCHLEITLEGMEITIKACPHDLRPSPFTQSEQELLKKNYNEINSRMYEILDRLAGN